MAYETVTKRVADLESGDRVLVGGTSSRLVTATQIATGEVELAFAPTVRAPVSKRVLMSLDDEVDVIVGGWPDRPEFGTPALREAVRNLLRDLK